MNPAKVDLGGRLVDWAVYGEHIPLKCKLCGAGFDTKNIVPIGCRTVRRGTFTYKSGSRKNREEYKKAQACDQAGHSLDDLEPDREMWNRQKMLGLA